MNERLRTAMDQAGVTSERLAKVCGVDQKTAERWVSTGRTPHGRHRQSAAGLLEVTEEYLWPAIADQNQPLPTVQHEIVGTYPDRASVPRGVWLQMLRSAEANIDVMVFAGTFLAQTNPQIAEMLQERANAGVQVRLCFGDPRGTAVEIRDREEGINGTLGAKIRASLSYFVGLVDDPSCAIRLHNNTLYASIFRYDDHALINPHIWGRPASANPLIHIQRVGNGGMFDRYIEGYDYVWKQADPWNPALNGGVQ